MSWTTIRSKISFKALVREAKTYNKLWHIRSIDLVVKVETEHKSSFVYNCVCVCVCAHACTHVHELSCSVVSDTLWPHGL